MDKNKKVLIVGAGGFIGGHLVKKILDNGNSVVATDIKPIGFMSVATTEFPLSNIFLTRWPPINPPAPTIKTFLFLSIINF